MDRVSMMMDLVNNPETILVEFILKSNKPENLDTIFCFYEGSTDKEYYNNRIELICDRNYDYFICGNKEKVKKAREMVLGNSRASTDKVAFFIDKDFDDDYSQLDLYVTPCYAIENLYTYEEAIGKILKKLIFKGNLSNSELEEYNQVKNLIIHRKEDFIEKTLVLNAFFSLQRKKGKFLSLDKKPDLKGIKNLKDSFFNSEVKLDSVNIEYDTRRLKEKVPNYVEFTQNELDNEIELLKMDTEKLLRGKFLNYFMVKILNELIEDSNKRNSRKILSKRRKVSFNICEETFISDYTSCAITPDCLKEFLKRYKN